jgi:hypothetical protein
MHEKDGKPFVGLVVDPQTSLKDGRPHFGAFRCYDRGFEKDTLPPPGSEYRKNQSDKLESKLCDLPRQTPHVGGFAPTIVSSQAADHALLRACVRWAVVTWHHRCPDGVAPASEGAAISAWGGQWNRYYKLDIEYFQSSMATLIMRSLKQRFLWVDDVASTPTKTQSFVEEFPRRVDKLNDNLDGLAGAIASGGRGGFGVGGMMRRRGGGGFGGAADAGGSGAGGVAEPTAEGDKNPALTTSENLARELCVDSVSPVACTHGRSPAPPPPLASPATIIPSSATVPPAPSSPKTPVSHACACVTKSMIGARVLARVACRTGARDGQADGTLERHGRHGCRGAAAGGACSRGGLI